MCHAPPPPSAHPHARVHLPININCTHKHVQAESMRVKAVMSLGDMYVLNLRRPSPPLEQLAPASARGRRVSPFDSGAAAAAVNRGGVERGGYSSAVEDDLSLAWVGPPLGRGEGAVGPILDIALVVVPCGKGGLHAGGDGGSRVAVGDCASVIGAAGGLEARVKIRLDAVRANVSFAFVENLTLHVLSGPLVSLLLRKDGAAGLPQSPGSAGSGTALSPSPPPMAPPSAARAQATADENRWGVGGSVDSSDTGGGLGAAVTGPALRRASSSSPIPTVAPADNLAGRRLEGAGDAPQQSGGVCDAEDGNSWEQLVLIKVRACVGRGGNGGGCRSVCMPYSFFTAAAVFFVLIREVSPFVVKVLSAGTTPL